MVTPDTDWFSDTIQYFLQYSKTAHFKVAFYCGQPNAKFTLHDFSTIFHSPTSFDKSPTNARDRRQIGARSRE